MTPSGRSSSQPATSPPSGASGQEHLPHGGRAGQGIPTLGRYNLVREIARSNDIVWEGFDPKMNRRVAVKELALSANLIGQARRDRIERFHREARAAGAMNHPNIVTIYEVGEDRGRFFIAMEYLDGQTLRERLTVAGTMPVSEAISITLALCDALEYAHNQGVVHRDIKPENVFVLKDGRVKLTDFGIARITHETQLTVAGQVFGTPSYMSPEQILGKEIDHRTDLFSLGVMLYEMVTGRKPFTGPGDSVITITYKILNELMPPVIGVSPILNGIIQQATAKDPAQRFQIAAEFRAMLNAALSSPQTPQYPAATPPVGYPTHAVQPTQMYGVQTQQGLVAPPAYPMPTGQNPPQLSPSGEYPTGNRSIPPGNFPPAQPTPTTNNRTPAVVALILVGIAVLVLGFIFGTQAYNNFLASNRSDQYRAEYNRAADLYKSGRYTEAAAQFRKTRLSGLADPSLVRQSAEGEVYSYRQLGHQAMAQGDFPAAKRWFQEALTVSPDDTQAKAELDGVEKRLQPVSSNSGETSNTVDPSPTPSLPPNVPPPPALGSVTTNDFLNANDAAANRAAQLLQEGETAYRNGDRSTALRIWLEATGAGPGSRAALQAQEYVIRVQQGRDPFVNGGG